MNAWQLTLKTKVASSLDASRICLSDWTGLSTAEIAGLQLPSVHAGPALSVGDVFSIVTLPLDSPAIVIVGDVSFLDFLGRKHSGGLLRVEGDVGNYCAAETRGGWVQVTGSTGHHLGSTTGASTRGMNGGRVEVGGSTGDYAGHRMRRGEIFIDGDAGSLAASNMIAGTVAVAGDVGRYAALAMRRGSLVVRSVEIAAAGRWTDSIEVCSQYPALVRFDSGPVAACLTPKVRRLFRSLCRTPFLSRRGDESVSGQGEMIGPRAVSSH